MKAFERKDKIAQLIHEFKEYDHKHHDFLIDFENSIYSYLADCDGCILLQKSFPEDLKVFSLSLINCAYDVLEKDQSYPSFRMKTELENIDKLNESYQKPKNTCSFSDAFGKIAKEKMIVHFPSLFDLSADGFRLLERSMNYRINAFLMFLYGKL